MHQKSSQYLNSLSRLLGHLALVRFVLFGVQLIGGFRLRLSSPYALFPLKSEPFMNYPG
jgi:hypothetical protein